MPDTRHHRGRHPEDGKLFGEDDIPDLRQAVADLSWLLSRDYSMTSALKLVGDRYALAARQRLAVQRSSCSDQALDRRLRSLVDRKALAGRRLSIDGYNILILIESALSGGNIFIGRDGCYRDLASVHGTYRAVEETAPAIRLIGETLEALDVADAIWILDAPVSNSGRLKGWLYEEAEKQGWNWSVELANNPDRVLVDAGEIVVSSDSWIIDRAMQWANLGRLVVESSIADARLIDLAP
jgi:hypothetical protein